MGEVQIFFHKLFSYPYSMNICQFERHQRCAANLRAEKVIFLTLKPHLKKKMLKEKKNFFSEKVALRGSHDFAKNRKCFS